MKIVSVRIAECRLQLPHVLKLGTTEIRTRDYLALRITTDTGAFGEALGYVRGTPLFTALDMLSRQILGRDPLMRTEIVSYLENVNVPGRSAFTRAISLIDIACWDILAKHAGLPLFRLLGGLRDSVRATAVAGYYMDLRSTADIAAEVSRHLDAGFERAKVMLKGNDPKFDEEYLKAVTDAAPGRVAADAHWSWATLTDAMRFCRDLDRFNLIFLEDPFAAEDWPLAHELQRTISTPIAMGEDVVGMRTLRDMVAGIGLLRVDATTSGGISGAIDAIHHAAVAGRNVFPHVFAPLHVHLACAFPNVESVEIIPPESGADPLETVLCNPPQPQNGVLRAGEEPGVGIQLNWKTMEPHIVRKSDIELDA